MTAASDGTPTSSVFLYEPFGSPSSSVTFATNSNPSNASDQSMGWAANPTRKVEGSFTLAIIQMGARVYIPSLGRFLQTDPIPGGNANAYVYPGDPINGNDYTGEFGISDIFHAVQSALHLVSAAVSRLTVTSNRQAAKPAAKPKATLASKPYSGGPNLPLGSNGKVDFKKLGPDPRYTTPYKRGGGYVNFSAGAGLIFTGGVGMIETDRGDYYYSSKGLSIPSGLSFSITASSSNPKPGTCSNNVSVFTPILLGGSVSADGSWEWGIGSPGVSIMNTCIISTSSGGGAW